MYIYIYMHISLYIHIYIYIYIYIHTRQGKRCRQQRQGAPLAAGAVDTVQSAS